MTYVNAQRHKLHQFLTEAISFTTGQKDHSCASVNQAI